ncbi:hypothetical protein LguiB_001592 [Lonicera macranthoides]
MHSRSALPAGPWKLPLLGNVLQLAAGPLPHLILKDLALKHGPLMHLQLGQISAIVISSPRLAKEVLKRHDLAFADRPGSLASEIIYYNNTNMAMAPYDEVWHLLESIKSSISSSRSPPIININAKIASLTSSIISRAAFGSKCKDEDPLVKLIRRAISLAGGFDVVDLFPSVKFLQVISGMKPKLEKLHSGTVTSLVTIEWAISEMIKNPRVMEKAQDELRNVLTGKKIVRECDIEELRYLKLVIKETLCLHPPLPLLLPRVCREQCEIGGYIIPRKTKVVVNSWAIARDKEYWDDAESFKPERFDSSAVDFTGNNLEYIPFRAGRRMCPGMSFGIANVEFPLAQLLYHFNWELPYGKKPQDLDMFEASRAVLRRRNYLCLIATPSM